MRFLILILFTAILFVASAIASYNYDMDPANGVDILEGFGAVITLLLGAVIVFYELDLFCTVFYFLVKPKTVDKSILNISANVSLILVFFNGFYKDIFDEDIIAPLIVFAIYFVLRACCFVMPNRVQKPNE